jgi:NitT/TauT family transport system substrate-binding protein
MLAGVIATGLVAIQAAFAADAVTLRLNWYLSGWMAPFYYAHQQGYFKDAGIDLTILEGRGSGPTVQIIGTKSDAFGFADVATMMLAASKGVKVKSISSVLTINDASVIFLEGTDIKAAEDLKGKRIAMTAGDSTTASFPAVLARNNIDREDVIVVQVDPAAKPVLVMEKQADALLGGLSDQPFLMREKGFKVDAVTFADLGVNLLGFSLITHDDMITENPDLVQRFVSAVNRGWDEARKDPQSVMSALTNVKADFNIERGLGQLKVMIDLMDSPNTKGHPVGYHAAADWEAMLTLLKDYRGMETDMAADAFYTNQFIPAN